MRVNAGTDDAAANRGEAEAAAERRAESGSSDADPREAVAAELPDLGKLAQDWITLWQSELSAMAADPELLESWQTVVNLWFGTLSAVVRAMPFAAANSPTRTAEADERTQRQARAQQQNWAQQQDWAQRDAGSADAPRTSATAAAPDARDAEIDGLAGHIAVLERRLAELERGRRPQVHPRRDPGRKSRR